MKQTEAEAPTTPRATKLEKNISFNVKSSRKNAKTDEADLREVPSDKPAKKIKFEKPLAKDAKKQKKSNLDKKTGKPLTKDTSKLNKKPYPKILNKNAANKQFKKGINGATAGTEKPDWMKYKKQAKELRQKRKAQKLDNIYDICIKAKQLCEKLRRSDCKTEERKTLTLKVHKLLETHYKQMIFTHDMSRIIQCVLKYCDTDIRKVILDELKPALVEILQSKYAKNCVRTILKYGSQEARSNVISACYGNIVKLACHNVSAPIIETAYSSATDIEKVYIRQEFYGDMFKNDKDKNIKSLSDVFQTATDMKAATLSCVKANLIRILNKNIVHPTLVHTILYEFLTHCSSVDRSEMIVMLRNSIAELSRSKFGAKVVVICVWHGTNKDRKFIMKCLKDHVKDIAMSEDGYLILLSLIDCVDDTVLMKKIIISEILKDLTEIALHECGKLVILYLVARRDPCYFHPNLVRYLKEGDGNVASKKATDVREKELLESVIDTLLKSITEQTGVWLSNGSVSMVTLAILKAGTGENLRQAFESIVTFIMDTESRIVEDEIQYRPIEHSGLHMVLKKLIKHDKELQTKGETTFGEILINMLTTTTLEEWIQFNRGCFIFVFLIENESTSALNILVPQLKTLLNLLRDQKTPGASVLLKKLKDL